MFITAKEMMVKKHRLKLLKDKAYGNLPKDNLLFLSIQDEIIIFQKATERTLPKSFPNS